MEIHKKDGGVILPELMPAGADALLIWNCIKSLTDGLTLLQCQVFSLVVGLCEAVRTIKHNNCDGDMLFKKCGSLLSWCLPYLYYCPPVVDIDDFLVPL
jgi:hypothetical protein